MTLVSALLGADGREARFEDGGTPGEAELRRARAAAGRFPADGARVVRSPSPRCLATAGALGHPAEPVAELAGCGMGRWRGRTLAEVAAAEGGEVARWLADPAAAPHGGESVLALVGRVGGWLDALPADGPRVLAVVEPDVVRAAVLHALAVPGPAFWRLDVEPLSATVLTGRLGRWNVRLAAAGAA
ncbi:histidine phosphatase family protein [Kitasatospora sp. NPDC059571]|uniref:histidine phosphatase family protein n=1 Tax=Kitasatospora sp. NPDC059571 TaxID=3346871 RepID=UPI00369AC024